MRTFFINLHTLKIKSQARIFLSLNNRSEFIAIFAKIIKVIILISYLKHRFSMKIFRILISLSIAYMAFACSDKGPQFTVEGTVTDADSTILYLEKRELNQTTILDSIRLDNKGTFKFKEASTPYPEFYVLRLNNQVINFAVDSSETVTLEASKNNFATNYFIDGNLANKQIKAVVLAQYKASKDINDLQQKFKNKEIDEQKYIEQIREIADSYKENAKNIIFSNLKSPAAYFALFQKVNGLLFFDPYDKEDYKIFAAVATAWDTYFKESPRSSHIRDYTLLAMKARKQEEIDLSQATSEVDANEYYNIKLPNVEGNIVELTSLKGKVVLLDFTTYQAKESPAHNMALNKIYSKFKPNFEIYQISFDADKHLWTNAAVNLPWIAVHESKSVNSDLIFKYNIQELPAMFLIDKNGDIAKRLLPTDNIEAEIQKIL